MGPAGNLSHGQGKLKAYSSFCGLLSLDVFFWPSLSRYCGFNLLHAVRLAFFLSIQSLIKEIAKVVLFNAVRMASCLSI